MILEDMTEGMFDDLDMVGRRLFFAELEGEGVEEGEWPEWLAREARKFRETWNSQVIDRWEEQA
jgi:hypothetical protein